ncbi:MAG: murein biosynthesis integral membrane protein MurJ [Anaerolineae bacterium]
MTESAPPTGVTIDRRGIAAAALIIAVGNVASRVLGLARESTITHVFGATGAVSAFRAASSGYNLLYELLIGGLISSALVPVLSEYAGGDRREFRRLVGSLATLLTLAAAVVIVVLEIGAPALTWLMAGGFPPELRGLTTDMIRLVLPAVLLMGLAGVFSAALYAVQQFAYPAFMASLVNLSMIVAALAFAGTLQVRALIVGMLVGSLAQLLLQGIGLRRAGVAPLFAWRHPAIRRVLALAAPVLLSLLVGQAQVVIDRNLASRTGEQSMAWMANATTLVQFPLGLVASAISLAALPTLARLAANKDGHPAFLSTLSFSLRLVLLLVVPATALLAVLGRPAIALLFEHGAFTPNDTTVTEAALRLYLIGLPFAAIDQCLILAFYARGDTLRPALVGIGAVGIYLAVALSTIGTLGMYGLVLANSAQWFAHAATMLVLTRLRLGGLRDRALRRSVWQVLAGAAAMTLFAAAALRGVVAVGSSGAVAELLLVLVPGCVGAAAYVAALRLMGNEELVSFATFLRGKLAGLARGA